MHASEGATTASSSGASAASPRLYFALGTAERHRLDAQLAQIKQVKREREQAREASKECVFRPRINDNHHGGKGYPRGSAEADDKACAGGAPTAAAAASGSVFDRLCEQARLAEERRRAREQAKREEEAAALHAAGFTPRINRKTSFDESLKHLEGVPVEDRLLFYGKAVARTAQLRREHRAREEREATGSLHTRAPHVGPTDRRRAQEAFDERNERLLRSREVKRQMAEKEAADRLTFQPRICAVSAAIDEAARQQQQQQQQPRQRQEEAEEAEEAVGCSKMAALASFLTLSSAVPPHAGSAGDAVTASLRGSSVDRGTLLYARGMQSQQLRAAKQEKERQREKHHGNRPQTNPLSEDWIAHGQHQKLFERDFVSRQAAYEAAKQEQLHLLARKHLEEQEAQLGGRQGAVVTPAELQEQVRRLYAQPLMAGSQRGRPATPREQPPSLSTDYSFKPQLSSGTEDYIKKLAAKREADVVKRLAVSPHPQCRRNDEASEGTSKSLPSAPPHKSSPDRKQAYHPQLAPQKRWDASPARSLHRETTPAPASTGKDPAALANRQLTPEEMKGFYERQQLTVRMREEKVKRLKQKALVEEMAECTFQPKTLASAETSPRALAAARDPAPTEQRVSGVQQYLQRQAEAKRLREEREERRQTMGMPRGDPNVRLTSAGNTVVSPFRLQTDKRHDRRRGPDDKDTGASRAQGGPSLFMLTTEERDRVLAADYREAFDAAAATADGVWGERRERGREEEEAAAAAAWREDDEADSEFEVHAVEPRPTDPRLVAPPNAERKRPSVSSSSGGEACYPRSESRRSYSQPRSTLAKPFAAFVGPLTARRSGSADKGSERPCKDGSRSVSFVGVPDTSPPPPPPPPSSVPLPLPRKKTVMEALYADPYDMTGLPVNLPGVRRR